MAVEVRWRWRWWRRWRWRWGMAVVVEVVEVGRWRWRWRWGEAAVEVAVEVAVVVVEVAVEVAAAVEVAEVAVEAWWWWRWWWRWRPATRRVDGVNVRDVSGVPRRRPDIGRRAVGREGRTRIHDLVRTALQRQGRLPDRRPVRSGPAANRPGHAELGPVTGDDDRAVGAHGRVVDDLAVEKGPGRVTCRAHCVEVAEAAREIDGAVRPDAGC